MKKVIAGMDLHSNNVVVGIMDMDGKRVAQPEGALRSQGGREVPGAVQEAAGNGWRSSPRITGTGWWTGCEG